MPNIQKVSTPHIQERDCTLGVDLVFEVLTAEERNKVIDDLFKGSTVHMPRFKHTATGQMVRISNPPSINLEDFNRDEITEVLNRWRSYKGGAKGVSQFVYNTGTHSYDPNPAFFTSIGIMTPDISPETVVPQPSEMLMKYAGNLYPAVEKARRSSKPVVFLAGSCTSNEWRERLKKAFSDKLCFIDPYDKHWDPKENIYPELAGLFIADHVVAYKGGSGTKNEEKFLRTIGKISKWRDFSDVRKITDYLEHLASHKHVKTAKDGVTYDYSSTQVNLPEDLSKAVISYGNKEVKDSDLYKDGDEKGRENEMHVTVLYGIISPDPDEVKDQLEGVGPFEVRLGLVTVFKEDKKYDVLKIDVESSVLQRVHYMLEDRVKNDNSHPSYFPHVTVAYVKKDSCDHLIGSDKFQGKKFKADSIVFSSKDGSKTQIKLRGER